MATYWVEISTGCDWENWSASFQGEAEALLSESQFERAKNVAPGDVLLHHIKGARCWSGYSTVLRPAQKIHEAQNEWEKAYPYKLIIKPEVYLTEVGELVLTRDIEGLSHNSWHRKSYVRVTKQEDVSLIIKAIDYALGKRAEADDEFIEKLKNQRDVKQSQTCKKNANYCCLICGTSDDAWREIFTKKGIDISGFDSGTIEPGWFLHAHHVKLASKGGNADLENLLCLCPNCHQVVHKLKEDVVSLIRSKV